MGNNCCKVNSYIDEEEEYMDPMSLKSEPTILDRKIEYNPSLHSIHDVEFLETSDEYDDLNKLKQNSIKECIISSEVGIETDDEAEISIYHDISSVEIVSTLSVQSLE